MTAMETPFVAIWTGREADALRAALRLTNEGYAERLGIAVRTVACWRTRPDVVPRQDTQGLLDTLFEQYERDIRVMRRFAAAMQPERRETNSPIVMVAEMALMQARIQELEARLAAGAEVTA